MKKTPLTEEQLTHLCKLYNEESDVKTLEFLLDNKLCNDTQQKELIKLLYEARKVEKKNIQKYFKDLKKFLTQFGMNFDYHYAYHKEETFTVVREYFKSVEIKANSPVEALNKAKATYAFDDVSLTPERTFVDGTDVED